MSSIDKLPLALRMFLHTYPWRRVDPNPSAPLRKSVDTCRIALVTSAGLMGQGEQPFDERLGGDFSYRVISKEQDVQSMREFHRSSSFDHSGIESDRNLAFPLDRLRELALAGEIGEVAPRHLSFMGSITAPGRLRRTSAPAAAQLLVEDQVDLALLVPV